MSNGALQTQVSKIVERHASDELILDALFQWATNPTSMSAGYGIRENQFYITQNLSVRYGLTLQDAGTHLSELQRIVSTVQEQAEKQSIPPREQIGEMQRALLVALAQGEPKRLLHQGVLKRLGLTSEATRRALIVFQLAETAGSRISPNDLTLPGDRWQNRQSEFQAYYNAVWGDTAPVLEIRTEIVKCGAYNELYWVPSPTAKGSPGPTLKEGIIPAVSEIEVLGTKLPRQPDVRVVLESHWQNRDFDLLRLIDIVSHSQGGCFSSMDELIPPAVSRSGIMGVHGQTIALSPVVLETTRQHMDMIKSLRMEGMRQGLETGLLVTRRTMGMGLTLGVLWTGMGEVLWKLDLSTPPPLYVYLAPWLTPFGQSQGLSCIRLHENPHVMLVIPYQSRPSILATLDKYSGLSISDTRWQKSITVLSDPETPGELQVLVGERHRLLDEILATLGQGTVPLAAGPPPTQEPTARPTIRGTDLSAPKLIRRDWESILIGHAAPGGEPVTWEPGRGTGVRQPNRNVVIVGKPGTGKSQLIKAFVLELKRVDIPAIALDWIGEYADVLPNAIDAKEGITINPLELPSGATPYQNALEIASIIRAVYTGLGDIQEALIRDAVLKAYEEKGILHENRDTWILPPPTFEDVVSTLKISAGTGMQRAAAEGLVSRISPFVTLRLFSGATTIPFERLIGEGSSIVLDGLYTDELRIVFGHFFLSKLWYYVQNLGATSVARFYLLLDEANRLAFPGSPLERLVREARKFGAGIIVASQRPGDFTDSVPANAACSIAFQCGLERDAAFMASPWPRSAFPGGR